MKIPLCGDPAVGKSSIVLTLCGLQDQEVSTSSSLMTISNSNIQLVDTNGQEDQDRTRASLYVDSDAFVIVFSVISPTSYNNVLSKWAPEVQRANSSNKPIILVGSKGDLRDDSDALQRLEARHLAPVSYDQGLRLQRQIGAAIFVECSSLSVDGLRPLLHAIKDLENGGNGKTSRSLTKSAKRRGTCVVL